MCGISRSTGIDSNAPASETPKLSSCFSCTRLNSTTFKVVEDDKWSENPFIYVKILHGVLVIFDTGCGGAAKDETVTLTSLRKFIESVPIPENNAVPLNENGKWAYVVVCSHCHFDHIGGIEQFSDHPNSTIWANLSGKDFIEKDLPSSSLSTLFGMETPSYTVHQWASDNQAVTHNDNNLGLSIFWTPGHTPDELALWDSQERVLYVGDTIYEWAPILIFYSLIEFSNTIGRLKQLVETWNSDDNLPRVKMACGHNTDSADAQEILCLVDQLLQDCISGAIKPPPPQASPYFGGELVLKFETSDGKLGLMGSERVFEEFRVDPEAMEKLSARQTV